ncbi:arsenate reductase ArsC [Methanochimaera problematica]|nr:arsenate reductase ArsC [Methanoplanus sp. FWC-SCC4]
MKSLKKSVLFVCTYNSARSPMAEGILKNLYGDRYESFSAGLYLGETDKRAVAVLAESGIDIKEHKPQTLGMVSDKKFDYIVFLCENAHMSAHYLPESKQTVIHYVNVPAGFGDDGLSGFRMLRESLSDWINIYFS